MEDPFPVGRQLLEGADPPDQVMVAHVKHPVAEPFRGTGDDGGDPETSQVETDASCREALVLVHLHRIAVDPVRTAGAIPSIPEDGRYGVVCSNPVESHPFGHDSSPIQIRSGSQPRHAAPCPVEEPKEVLLDLIIEEDPVQLDRPSCVSEDLKGLDSSQVIEEPAAARIHEHGVALELQKLQRLNRFVLIQGPPRLAFQEFLDVLGIPIQHHLDVSIATSPGIRQEPLAPFLEGWGQGIPKVIQRLPEGLSPPLPPLGIAPGAAAAVGAPPLDPMDTAPRRIFQHPRLPGRRVPLQVLRVVRETDVRGVLDDLERVGEGHLPVPMVVSVGLAIGGDVVQGTRSSNPSTGVDKPSSQSVSVAQEPLEGHGPGEPPVIEEGGDATPRRKRDPVDTGRIHPLPPYVDPAFPIRMADRLGLAGRQDGKADSRLGHELQRLHVHRRLREPHPLGKPAEAGLEVPDAPEDLGSLVATVRQGEG